MEGTGALDSFSKKSMKKGSDGIQPIRITLVVKSMIWDPFCNEIEIFNKILVK